VIRKLLNRKIDSLSIAALTVALSSLLSRFLGIFRDRVLASSFGAGETLDVYYAAFRVPDLIFNLLVLGALSAGFIPIFSRLISNGDKERAWKLANLSLNIFAVVLFVFVFFGFIFASYLVDLLAPGFSAEAKVETVTLTRIMFLSPLFLGLSSVLGGILQSFRVFFVYSLSPIMYNIGIIVGAIYFTPIWGIYGLAYGVVLGAFFHFLVQVPAVFKLGFSYNFNFDWRNKDFLKLLKMMLPRTLSLAVVQLNFLVITSIASTLVVGSLTVFNLANNLQSFPIGIFGISFAIAAFPSLSVIAFNNNKLIEKFSYVFRQILFFIVPSMVLMVTLRAQIIRVVLGYGNFSWDDTVLTFNTLGFFSISLFAQATIPLLNRIFYARNNTMIPFLAGLLSAVVNFILAVYLKDRLGVPGLALAFSVASIANFIFLWVLLRVKLGNLDEGRIIISILKFSLAAIAAGMAVQAVKYSIVPYIDMTKFWGILVHGTLSGFSGIFIYLLFCASMGSEESYSFWYSIKRRLPKRQRATTDSSEARGI